MSTSDRGDGVFRRLGKFFAAPSFETDEENFRARVVQSFHWMLFTAVLVLFFVQWAKGDTSLLVICGILAVVVPMLSHLLRRGYLRLVCVIDPLLVLLVITYQSFTGNGLHDLSLMAYPVVIVLAGLLLGRKAPVVFGVLAFFLLVGVFSAETLGLIRSPYRDATDPGDLVTILVLLGMTATLLTILIGNLTTSLEQARRQEAILAKANRQLERQNAELEQFTYTVSHDLRNPLVTIRAFLGYVERAAAEGDADRLAKDIRRIYAAADSMESLLRDLLELSRSGVTIRQPEEIPAEELIHEVLDLLAGKIKERGLRVEVSNDMPPLYGDRRRLHQVFQNLIGNATKFMGDQPDPRIEIGGRGGGEENTYWVRDNGMGIDGRYGQKIFDLFERLDPKGEGTGVGLALVKRIVELHGGQIVVESAGKGQGATFRFTLTTARLESGS